MRANRQTDRKTDRHAPLNTLFLSEIKEISISALEYTIQYEMLTVHSKTDGIVCSVYHSKLQSISIPCSRGVSPCT